MHKINTKIKLWKTIRGISKFSNCLYCYCLSHQFTELLTPRHEHNVQRALLRSKFNRTNKLQHSNFYIISYHIVNPSSFASDRFFKRHCSRIDFMFNIKWERRNEKFNKILSWRSCGIYICRHTMYMHLVKMVEII